MRTIKSASRETSRDARLAEKLRENLKRRKGKVRAQQSTAQDVQEAASDRDGRVCDDDRDGA
jgi:hypothetical protein